MLEKHLWNSFLLYLVVEKKNFFFLSGFLSWTFTIHEVVEILQLLHEMSSFPEVLYKRSVLKNFSEFTDKHKKQSSSGGVLSKEKMFLKILQNSQKNIFAGVSSLIKLQGGNLKLSEAATGDVLYNKVFLKISQMSQEKTFVGVSF